MFDDCGRCEDDAAPVRRHVPPRQEAPAVQGSPVMGGPLTPSASLSSLDAVDRLLSRLVSSGDDIL